MKKKKRKKKERKRKEDSLSTQTHITKNTYYKNRDDGVFWVMYVSPAPHPKKKAGQGRSGQVRWRGGVTRGG